ncbi:Glucose-responsive transcription factor [Acarospora aff. strigata]|nr:Glucose-responsive transcription factor [Acarospora aff. strigata]
MPATQSYPSPTAVQMGDGAHPFYTSQQQLPSADELQLSAQLSRNVAPNMTGNIADGQEMVPPGQAMQDLRQQASPEELAQGGLDPNHDPSFGDPTPRKRSKVSRACDECRRKKIRCDATSESGVEQCSNCKRVGSRCQFSRVPMKRGPSKGYIKELADRLNTLENQLPVRHPDLQQYTQMSQGGTPPRAMNEFSPASDGAPSRKRTHSMSECLTNPAYVQAQMQRPGDRLPSIGDWSAPDAPRHLPHLASGLHIPQASQSDANHISSGYRSQVSPNGTAQPLWRYGQSDIGRRESFSIPFASNEVRPADHDHNATLLEWDDETIDEYYRIIHPTYPLLPHSISRLRSRLLECPAALRVAFLEALYAAVRSSPAAMLRPVRDFQGVRKASELITGSQFEAPTTRSKATNLIYLQTMILIALEADNHGPATKRAQPGPPRALWLGAAVGLSYSMKLHINPPRGRFAPGDMDSDENLGRRNWCTLVILDRWHAVSTSSPLLIPDTSVVLLPEDQSLLGDSTFHLIRLSCIVGHLAELFVAPEDLMSPPSTSAPLISRLLAGEMERFRESVDSILASLPLVHLAYWHIRLLMKCHTPGSEPIDLLGPAEIIARILNSNSNNTSFTPLTHHFAALAALTLAELVDISDVRDVACLAIKELQDALDKRRPGLPNPSTSRNNNGNNNDDSTTTTTTTTAAVGWVGAVRDLLASKTQHQQKQQQQQQQQQQQPPASSGGTATANSVPNQGSLQHLADLAVGESENGAGGGGGGGAPALSAQTAQAGMCAEKGSDAPLPPLAEFTALTRGGYLMALGQGQGQGLENGR